MPHIIIEHSANAFQDSKVNLSKVLELLAAQVINTQIFNPENIKIRLQPVLEQYLPQPITGFVHIQCRIHQGRSIDQKKQLSDTLVDSIAEFCQRQTVITCEVVDMDSDSYSKKLL